MSNLNINGQLGFELLSSQAKQVLLDFVYPKDTYFITENKTLFPDVDSVKNHFGGKWERLDSRFLYATSDLGAVGHEDGEASHTLTCDEMPSHYHTLYADQRHGMNRMSGNASSWSDGNVQTGTQTSRNTTNAGNGKAHNNMPPYREVLMYRRIE